MNAIAIHYRQLACQLFYAGRLAEAHDAFQAYKEYLELVRIAPKCREVHYGYDARDSYYLPAQVTR